MNLSDQSRAPIFEALERYKSMRIVPFDVPGHKRGKGNPPTCTMCTSRRIVL